MQIVDFDFCENRQDYLEQIECFEWGAAKFLANILRENRLREVLGGWVKLFLLVDEKRLVSFVTLSAQDCIPDKTLVPWLGFFHTTPEYRGNRYGKNLLDYACEYAKQQGYKKVYLATDHVNLYEKYGFNYIENRVDIYGEDSRIYCKLL